MAITRLKGGLLLPLDEEEVYPLAEIARLEDSDIATMVSSILKEWTEKRCAALYADGHLTLSRLAEILDISIWEAMDLVKAQGVPFQMGRTGEGA